MHGMKYTEEMRKFIFENYKGITSKELAECFNVRFHASVKESQMKGFKGNNRLASGVDCRFKKGQSSHNKGVKMPKEVYEKAKHAMFRKGNIPYNHKPVGSERIDNKDGYTLVKTREPKTWELKQHIVWKEHHGEVPAGYKVIFLDGDKGHFDIENLALVSKLELLTMNRHSLISRNSDLTQTGILVAQVINKKNAVKN